MNRIITHQASEQVYEPDSFQKGEHFETYIKMLFNQDHFHLKKWRKSGSIPKDTFILEYSYPDLELIFAGKNHYPFAVECKWRKQFYKGKINWATEDQISKYVDFQNKRTIPVFIAIGVGGIASNPEKLFVTPLCNLAEYPEVYEHQLIKYQRKPSRRFFFDTIQLKLF
jgi:Holliday junction resolvase